MACRLDVKKAILDEAFNEMFEGRYTFTRLTDDTVRINNRADAPKSRALTNAQAKQIAEERLKAVALSFKNAVTGYVSQYSPYDPVTITLYVTPAYVEHEYQKLPEDQKTDPKDGKTFQPIVKPAVIKPGVKELFDSTPELANAVYEALGIYNVWHASDKKIDKFISENVEGYFAKVKKGSPKAIFFTANKAPQESFLSKREYQEQFAVKMNNPLVVDTKTGYSRDNESFKELVDRALAGNHDGVIVKNVDDNGFVGDVYISLNANQISKITPQQKQQAQQLYSQYLDTIFPDSKVKDIVYHGTNTKFDKFNKSNLPDSGIYFDKNKTTAYGYGNILIPAILNSSGYYYGGNLNRVNSKQIRENGETGLTNGSGNVVFEPEQIHILGGKQDIEGFKEFVSGEGKAMLQLEGTEVSKASPKTIALVKDFLKRIGVDIKKMQEIVINGKRESANGAALIMQKLVQVVEGKEAEALPEEAMHFAVEIIKQTNPKLYNQLLKEINNYALYKQVLADYSTNPNYQTKDGKPNIQKLKEEAIGKVLAETIINKNEGTTEKPENLAKAQSWWSSILDWLKSLFVKSGFDKAAMSILSGENIGTVEDIRSEQDNVFLQKSQQDKVFEGLKDMASKIEKKDDGYYVDGKKVPTRVTDLVKDWYERRFATKDLTKSEFQTAVDDLKAEKGTAGHADLEYIFSLFVDKDGYLRESPLDDSGYTSQIDPESRKIYDLLKTNLEQRLNSYPKGTRFLSEIMVYDAKRGLAGTIDFVAITPEGKVNVLDWKFMDLNVDKYQDVPWYKVNAWQKQMKEYTNILQSVYGVKPQDFGQTMMIPIKVRYSSGDAKKNILPKLMDIEIGGVVVKDIKEDYLIPVALKTQKTGKEEIDTLIEKLNNVYKKLSEKKVLPSEKLSKSEQLNALFKAIRHLQMRQDVRPLVDQARILNKQMEELIRSYREKFEGKDANSFTDKEVTDFTESLELGLEAISTYTQLSIELESIFEGSLSEEDEKLQNDIGKTTEAARSIEAKLKKIDKKFTSDVIGKRENVENLSTPEKIIKGMAKWFGNTATIQLKALEVLFKKANRAFGYAAMDTLNETKKLLGIKEEYDKWAKARGLSAKNYFDILKKKDKNELIDEFDPEFYSELKKRVQDRDFQWIRDNIDVPAYNTYLKGRLAEEIERIESKVRLGSDEEINAQINKEKSQAARLYNTSTAESPGWFIYDEVKKFPKREKWESEQWKNLNKAENAPAKAFYDYIKERNEYYQEIGYIHAAQARTFLPWVRQGLSEKLIFGGKMSLGEQFLRNISLDENETGFGQIDPSTGRPIDTIPIYFTRELEAGEESKDLFKTMALYNEFAIKFKYLSDIEAQGRALLRLERNKKAIRTSYFGKTQYKDGDIDYTPDNNENSELYEKMLKAIVYQQKFIESETFDQVLGRIGGFGKKINDKLGYKLLPENLEGRQLSLNKALNQLNNTFQVNALGLNVLSSMSNLFGGSSQSLINAGKYYTKSQFVSTEMWILGQKMGNIDGLDRKKAIAALEYFLPLTENYGAEIAKKLALNKISGENIQDFLMILMRNSEKAVQTTNFYSYLRNTIVEDGKLYNVREYLRSTPEYADMYAGTKEQRDARMEKFEKDADALLEEKGVLKVGKVENNEFVIPGVDRKSESVIELRRIVQQINSDALGSLSADNKRLINMNVYGNSFMVFKNWIPRLVDVRIGGIKYNAGTDAYEWGRTRMVMKIISDDLLGSIGNLRNSLVANDKGIAYIRELYEKKKADYEKDTGKVLDMTESEFIDLVRQNIKNQLVDVVFYAALIALVFGLKALAPDDDEDPIVKNQYKFILKATDKFKDEIGYFYDPTSFTKLVSGGLFPSINLLDNYKKVFTNFLKENYALAMGDEEAVEKNYVIKYLLRSFPLLNQGQALLPMFYPELAKDLGIKMQSQSGIR